jgi:guanylate kinase
MDTILTLVGPSGSGKTTLANRLIEDYGYTSIVSHTTRPMRKGEKNGIDYYFITQDEFKTKLENEEFIENISFNGNMYGVSINEIHTANIDGKVPVLIVEPKGLSQIKIYCQHKGIQVVSIYIGGKREVLIERILVRELLNTSPTKEQLSSLSKRLDSLQDELNTWWRQEYYTKIYPEYNGTSEDTIISEVRELITYLSNKEK